MTALEGGMVGEFRVEYVEAHVPLAKELVVRAREASRIVIHSVTRIGDEMKFCYTVVWDPDPEGDDAGRIVDPSEVPV